MTISFIDDDKFRTNVYQDSKYIGHIRYTKLEDFILAIDEDVCLDFSEVTQIYKKIGVMDSRIPRD